MGFRCLGHPEGHRDGLPGKELVVGVDQIDCDFVLTGQQVLNVDGSGVARFRPMPRRVVDVDVPVADAGVRAADCQVSGDWTD